MGNQTSAQKPPKRQAEQSKHNSTSISFQPLKALPSPFEQAQCVLHKHEILICGGYKQRACYSYHTLKDEYEFICKYPSHVILDGHCVVNLVRNSSKNSNETTLLSFGSSWNGKNKHTLVMKYVSVWSNHNNENKMNKSTKSKKSINYHQWVPFTDNNNNPIIIGRDQDEYHNYCGVRAVVGGSNNHLLFLTYHFNNISVFDLNTLQFITHSILPTLKHINYHCFVLRPENGQEMTKKKNQMLLFYEDIGLSIKYDENKNRFEFYRLPVCDGNSPPYQYAYVCINNAVLFFGGCCWDDDKAEVLRSVYKYSIQENKWTTFQNILPGPLESCAAILSEDNTYVHIIGGIDEKNITLSTHMKTRARIWDISQLEIIQFVIKHWIRTLTIKLGWVNDLNNIVINYVRNIYIYIYIYLHMNDCYELLMVLQGHEDTVSSVRFSADCRKIVSASCDHTVRIWDVLSGKQLQIFIGHTDFVIAARFSPDEHTVVSCSGDGTIRLWDINTGTEVMKLARDFDQIWDVDFSPDGRYIVSGLRDRTIRLWDVHSGIEVKQLLEHPKSILSTQFSPDGKMIASSSSDKTINLWNVESGEILKKFEGHSDSVRRARFSADGKSIVSCSFDCTIRIWNIETGEQLKKLKEHKHHVNDIKYLPDAQTIVSCSNDNTIRLWDLESGKTVQILLGHSDSVNCVDVSQNGNIIISGSDDCKIQIWGLL
ncbi:WD-40 repeat protein [Reticulomyxa filosa]|uniref:WD-40 repeat protein n=1 Tax=Reticulomyxa filosa TaxID=46433 RepID=X6P475_RETFI|nr:WD-40 repeat protein [Reticulomyxa filosa]|eukprot:ETO33355.1 WD-40 repeat protein [Reticulomyxa filosa]